MNKKNEFRIWAKEIMSKDRGVIYDKEIINYLKRYIKSNRVKSLLAYVPLADEVDIIPLIKFCRQNNINVYVPFMDGKSFTLVKYRLPLHKKCFGVKEPNFSKQYRIKDINLAIIPIVGVDANCKRIGFGKGMYDRFFDREGKDIKNSIFIQRVICYSREVITDKYDIRADMVIGKKIKIWNR